MGDDSIFCHVYNDTKQLKYFNWRLKNLAFSRAAKLIWTTVYRSLLVQIQNSRTALRFDRDNLRNL